MQIRVMCVRVNKGNSSRFGFYTSWPFAQFLAVKIDLCGPSGLLTYLQITWSVWAMFETVIPAVYNRRHSLLDV